MFLGTFSLEGWFISDFGTDFKYKKDPPNDKAINTISFPSLKTIFEQPWIDQKSRYFSVSTTYIKSRIVRLFISQEGRYPNIENTEKDIEKLNTLTKKMLDNNKLEESFINELEVEKIPYLCNNMNVLTSSVLGSFLAQEVVVGVSLAGTPGFNVFIFDGLDCSVKCFPIAKALC